MARLKDLEVPKCNICKKRTWNQAFGLCTKCYNKKVKNMGTKI